MSAGRPTYSDRQRRRERAILEAALAGRPPSGPVPRDTPAPVEGGPGRMTAELAEELATAPRFTAAEMERRRLMSNVETLKPEFPWGDT